MSTVISSRERLKVVIAASLGTLIENYDLFIAGVAATIAWPTLFFPPSNPGVALAASYATLAAAYFTRPIGAYIFGHFGDRHGRKVTLIWTLVLMGAGVLGIALTPSYAAIGVAAPMLVIVFRILQGIGLGGEYGAAASWVAEFAAKSRWRSFWSSWVQQVNSVGIGLSTISFTIVGAFMTNSQLIAYGWRIVFIIGAIALAIAGIIRYITSESPLFEDLRRRRALERRPALQVYKEQGVTVALLGIATISLVYGNIIVVTPFTISWMAALRFSPLAITSYITISTWISSVLIALGGVVASITGKKRLIVIIAALWTAFYMYPYYTLLGTRVPSLVLFGIIGFNIVRSFALACIPALLTEYFTTRVRISGSGQAYQIGSLGTGIITGVIMPLLFLREHGPAGAAPYLFIIFAGLLVVAAVIFATYFRRDVKEEELPT